MQKQLLKFWMLLCMLMVGMGAWAVNETFTFADVASENSWSNGVAYTNVTLGNFTFEVSGGGNNGKYYTSDVTWRFYSEGGLTITPATGYTITSVTSNPSQTFTVSNGVASTSFSGTVKFKSITITYTTSNPVDASWSVSPAAVSVKATKSKTAAITTNYDGTLAVSSNNTGVATATINDNIITVTGVAVGTTTLNVTGAATSSYNAISKTINVTVTENVPTPGTFNATPNNAFWGTSYSGAISSVTANSLTFNGEIEDIAVQLKNGTSTNGYVNDAQTRVYNGYSMKFSAPTGYDITGITFTAGDAWAGTHTASVGTMTNNKNWTGAANEVTINFKGNCQINSISVTYAVHVAPTVTYTVTFNAGTNGTCATSDLTEASSGAGITLPEATPIARYDFVGWSTSATPTSANAGVAGATYYPTEDCTLYAYYTKQIPSFSGAYIDFDLSTDNTTTATEDAMTWVNSLVNIAAAKADATTPTNNYYPGASTPRASTRFYTGSTLTFTPASGVTITGIEYIATSNDYTTAFGNSTWTNGDAVADAANKIAYVTPEDGTQAVSATIGVTTGGTKLRVYYTAAPKAITISIGYATFYADYAVTLPAGVDAYVAYVEDGFHFVKAYEATQTVPANTPVVLKAENGNYSLVHANGGDAPAKNGLKGAATAMTAAEMATANPGTNKYYAFSIDAETHDNPGFYWIAAGGAAFDIPAGKAYFVVPVSAGAKSRFVFDEDGEATAIESVETVKANSAAYNLNGQRVNANTKGIVIINGKKFYNK